jgi:hypothetical protein
MTSGEAGYLAHLEARDGVADLDRHLLSRREAILRELSAEPLRSARRIDAAAFRRNLGRRAPERDLDDTMLWLLATAKANQAERFAVGLAELYGKLDADDPVRVHISLQEVYHTHLLAGVVALFGLAVRPQPPARSTRMLVKLLLTLPERVALPLTGAAEMVGCVLFRALRDRGVELLAGEPAVAARVRILYDQILTDEIGHVGYCANRLGRTGRALMRALYRVLALQFAASMPEIVRLFGRYDLRRRFGAEFSLEEMMRELPDGAYAAAIP